MKEKYGLIHILQDNMKKNPTGKEIFHICEDYGCHVDFSNNVNVNIYEQVIIKNSR